MRPEWQRKFGKDSMQVTTDGPRRQEQALGICLLVRPESGQRCDLALLGGQRRHRVAVDARFGLAGGS